MHRGRILPVCGFAFEIVVVPLALTRDDLVEVALGLLLIADDIQGVTWGLGQLGAVKEQCVSVENTMACNEECIVSGSRFAPPTGEIC